MSSAYYVFISVGTITPDGINAQDSRMARNAEKQTLLGQLENQDSYPHGQTAEHETCWVCTSNLFQICDIRLSVNCIQQSSKPAI